MDFALFEWFVCLHVYNVLWFYRGYDLIVFNDDEIGTGFHQYLQKFSNEIGGNITTIHLSTNSLKLFFPSNQK